MKSQINQVCIYSASSDKVAQSYFNDTAVVAKQLVQAGVTIIYGGGGSGLMGHIANKTIEYGGKVIGVMPEFMREVEWAHKNLNEIHFVADMHARKKRFLENTDAVVALAGGCGTLEELLEVITLKRLGLFTKPIIILNSNGFYDPLIEMLERCIEQKFMAPKHRNIWSVCNDPELILQAIENAPPGYNDITEAKV